MRVNVDDLVAYPDWERQQWEAWFQRQGADAQLDVPRDFTILNRPLRVTPRKIVIHILMHEIRHWAQIATLLRLHGLNVEPHDFLISP